MKKRIIFALAIFTLSLNACDEVNPEIKSAPSAPININSFHPESASRGASVTLFGENFGASTADNYVTFNGIESEVTQVQGGIIVVRVPSVLDPGDYSITLSSNGNIGTSKKSIRIN